MSVLTKALVVLVSLAAVALSMLLAANVVNQENLSDKLAAADATIKTDMQLLAAAKNQATSVTPVDPKSSPGTVLQAQVTSLQGSLADANARAQAATSAQKQQESQLASLSALNTELAAQVKALNDELAARRKEVIDTQAQLVSVKNANVTLESDRAGTDRTIAALNQQLDKDKGDIATLQKTLSAIPEDIRMKYMPGSTAANNHPKAPSITGKVTSVDAKGGDTWLQIDLGAKDKVEKEMVFLVTRGGNTFLGNLVIKAVTDDAAAGRVELLRDTIQPGDIVVGGQ